MINFDPPTDSETYVHRIGRTGRAGASGIGVTLVAPSERREVSQMAGQLGLEHGLGGGSHSTYSRPPASSPSRGGAGGRSTGNGRGGNGSGRGNGGAHSSTARGSASRETAGRHTPESQRSGGSSRPRRGRGRV